MLTATWRGCASRELDSSGLGQDKKGRMVGPCAHLLIEGERLLHSAQRVVSPRQNRQRLALQLQARRVLVHYLGRLQRLQMRIARKT